MTNSIAETTVASELPGDRRVGTFRLGVAFFTTIEAGTGLGRFRALSLRMSS